MTAAPATGSGAAWPAPAWSAPGRVGIWTAALEAVPAERLPEVCGRLEEQGWASLWFGEAYGREAFTHAALLLAATRRMVVATGIANIYARDPVAAAGAARTLSAAYPGRLVCGLGVSHSPLVERVRGGRYLAPVAAMTNYLDRMDAAVYRSADAAAPPPPRLLAALGPRMLDLARDRAQGAHPYLVTPEHTGWARACLGESAALVVEQAVVLATDPEVVSRRAHAHLEFYTGLPNYRRSWSRLGFTDADYGRGGSERLAAALVAGGDEAAIAQRVQEHLQAGASQVCVQVLGESVEEVPERDWLRLAPALVGLGGNGPR